MQFGVLSYAYSINIGDEIQTIAASQFLPRIDTLIERDRLHFYRKAPETFVILNGWFTHQPEWPPPDSIRPLFVSFYANKPEFLIDRKYVGYYKKFEPIGCRSFATVEAFTRIGIEAYFSGCLTLTLEKNNRPRNNRIYAIDVEEGIYERLVPKFIRERAFKLRHEVHEFYSDFLRTGIRTLNKLDQDGLYFNQIRKNFYKNRHDVRLRLASKMLDIYSEAKLIITSRLHCAMPCLALGTPVILLRPGVENDQRFAGLRELIRYYSDSSKAIDIDWDDPEPNSSAYIEYANQLKIRCKEAVKKEMSST